MQSRLIHSSGYGADKLEITSEGNGLAYNIKFGEAGGPMRNIYLQGEDATIFRAEYDKCEALNPDTPSSEIWWQVLDYYL